LHFIIIAAINRYYLLLLLIAIIDCTYCILILNKECNVLIKIYTIKVIVALTLIVVQLLLRKPFKQLVTLLAFLLYDLLTPQ